MSIFGGPRVPQPRPAGHVERAFNPDMVTDEQDRYRADACQDCGEYALDISPSDAACRCGKPLFSNETRIANLERLVKSIAAHLGIEG